MLRWRSVRQASQEAVRALSTSSTIVSRSTRAGCRAKPNFHDLISPSHHLVAQKIRYSDVVRLSVKGGKGGNGCSSFGRTTSGLPVPNGQNGAIGGAVLLRSNADVSTFSFPTYHVRGKNGEHGGPSDKGKPARGEDTVIDVPPGTVVKLITGRDEKSRVYRTRLLTDLARPGMVVKIAEGGDGGFGNKSFKSAVRLCACRLSLSQLTAHVSMLCVSQNNRKFAKLSTLGSEGEGKDILLELKTIAGALSLCAALAFRCHVAG
jgi:GTP-binding protein